MSTQILDADALIDAHPQADRIRRVQRTAYRAFSKRHKLGLDSISLLGGYLAPLGFAWVESHRHEQAIECQEAVDELLHRLGNDLADRRVISLLLEDYPGRDIEIAGLLQAHLRQSH